MIAAIYARKSTESLVADEEKLGHSTGRTYAARKGWTVAKDTSIQMMAYLARSS